MAEKQVKWWQWAIPIVLLLGIWVNLLELRKQLRRNPLISIRGGRQQYVEFQCRTVGLGFRYGLDDFLGLRAVSGLC